VRRRVWFVLVVLGVAVGIGVPAGAASEAVTVRVSVASAGVQADDASSSPSVSDDGSLIVYMSITSNLVPGDTNGYVDVFAYEVATGRVERISVDGNGGQANYHCWNPVVSSDGSTIVYESFASNLVPGDTNGYVDVFAYEVATGRVELISVDGGFRPSVSSDGSVIVYESSTSNAVPGDTNDSNDVFAFDVATGVTSRISVDSHGTQANGYSHRPMVSSDGSTIVYESSASNLVPGDTNERTDVFAYDMATGVTSLVSVDSAGNQANEPSWNPAVSGDGSIIVYNSYSSNLVAGDSNGFEDVFMFDATTELTSRVSVDSSGTQGNHHSYYPAVSSDGSTIVYRSRASNLVPGDTNGETDVFAFDVATGVTSRVSVDSAGDQADGSSFAPVVSGDGSTIAYESYAKNLVPDDTNGEIDVFARLLKDPVDDDPFDDDDGSVFEDDIRWLAASGITTGCTPTKFCPDSYVTRAQMAAFLTRALDLPTTDTDFFADDSTSIFEDEINRLAASGITTGCSPTEFCPDSHLNRGQMAALLVRGLGYVDDGGGDLFVDDDVSIFEADIDRLATAGVTVGCNPPSNDRYCPTANVTRGQMAAFLHRALG
jgi:Tol biopolymer transport system component